MMESTGGLDDFMYYPRLSQQFVFSDSATPLLPLSPLFSRSFGSISGTFPPSLSFNDGAMFKDEQDLDPTFDAFSFSWNSFDDTIALPTFPICPLETSPQAEDPTMQPQPLFIREDKRHVRAEDAIKARRSQPKSAVVSVKQEVDVDFVPPVLESRKRRLPTEEPQHAGPKVEIVNSISSYSRSIRRALPLPRREKKTASSIETSPAGHLKSLVIPSKPHFSDSPVSSSSSLSRNDSDYEPDNTDDNDYFPGEPRLKKRRKRSCHNHHHKPRQPHDRKLKKTQLQIVLDDLPYTMEDIFFSEGHYHCPFPDCFQSTTSEGDLGRHLESSTHATHRYVCLSVGCLEQFAREDSMKRHHANNRGKHHKAEHERAVKRGFPFRVRINQAAALKENIITLARAEGRL